MKLDYTIATVGRTVSWSDANYKNLILGKEFLIHYRIKSISKSHR